MADERSAHAKNQHPHILRHLRIHETPPQLEEYQRRLWGVIDYFDVVPQSFSNLETYYPRELAVAATIRLLVGLQIPPSFLDNQQAGLIALAVGDAWATQTQYEEMFDMRPSVRERDHLLSILKTTAVGMNNGRFVSFSERVAKASTQRTRRNLMHNPEVVLADDFYTVQNSAIYDCINRFTNPVLSQQWNDLIAQTHPGSLLYGVRQFMQGIPERPVNIFVLSIDSTELMQRTHGGIAWHIRDAWGRDSIVFPSDITPSMVEHEMGHQFFAQLAFGNKHLLFGGLDEAWTEASVQQPESYREQRSVLYKLLMENRQIGIALGAFYRTGDESYKDAFLSHVVNIFGLYGLLQIARMGITPQAQQAYRWVLDPTHVFESLRINPRHTRQESFRLAGGGIQITTRTIERQLTFDEQCAFGWLTRLRPASQ